MKYFLYIAFFHFLFSRAVAQDVFLLQPEKEPQRIGKYFEFFEDTSANLTLEEVLKQPFQKQDHEVPNFNITKNAIWGHLRFTCRVNGDWYLQLDPGSFNQVLCYERIGQRVWSKQLIGNNRKLDQRTLPVNHYLFKLDLFANDTLDLYFCIRDYYPVQMDLQVGSLESFVGVNHDSDLYNGICYGIMIMMMIYNLYLYVTQKLRVYLYYLLYVFFSMVFSAYLSGYALHFPAPLLALIQFAPIVPPAFFGVFGLLFTVTLFKEALGQGFKRILYIFMIVAVSDVVLSATPLVHLSEQIIQPLGLLLGVLSITAAIIALRKKHSSAVFYLLGFGAYMLSLFFLILSAQDVFSVSSMTWHALVTGSAIESIMLSFALGDKLKVSLVEKEKAQQEAMHQLMENERLVKEQNIVLEAKVKERTIELEEKNKEILDSIYYARRIQYTLLAQSSFLKSHLPEHFVLFKPKDIVSGDFYWAAFAKASASDSRHSSFEASASDSRHSSFEASASDGHHSSFEASASDGRHSSFEAPASEGHESFYLAVCDSTGHGVPGAFMSLLNISFLNEAVTEKKIRKPNKVFDHVRSRLIENISQEGAKDGMDAILVSFQKSPSGKQVVQYAAANNAPLLVRNGEIIPLPKDKMPVGQGERQEPFTLHVIELQKGDCLYLYTDGFGDQFGGPKGKKFKHQQLAETLRSISHESMEKQKVLIEGVFLSWKGNLEQVDDVCIIGLRV